MKDALRKIKGVDFKYHAPDVSYIEAVFARGDRRLADALERAYRLGCKMDGWSDQFKYEAWLQAFRDANVDPDFYACRERSTDEILPWDHLDAGITKDFLKREWDKAQKGETTRDCRKGCVGCGVNRYEEAKGVCAR